MKKLTVIPGDGIGPEVMNSVIEVLQSIRAPFTYDFQDAGEVALRKHGELLPAATLSSIEKTRLAIKGPTSINVALRKIFDLYANVRPVKSLPALPCVSDKVNLTIVRENTEDLYAGIERMVDDETAESIKRITKKGSERIARYAYELAKKTKRKKVSIVHKANIMKMTDGLFLRTCLAVAKEFPEIETKDVIIDNCCMQLVTRPEQFEIIVTENLYGDILSDLCAGLVGGLGIVPGANIGSDMAIFEAVHGSAPDIAGQNKANPVALLQSSIMLLQHIGEVERADSIMKALIATLGEPQHRTADLGGKGNTQVFTKALIQKLNA